MKKVCTILLCLSFGLYYVSAQVPQLIKYQAVLRDAAGNVKASESVNIDINVMQDSTNGTVVYTETHSTNTNTFGLVNLEIGSKNPSGFVAIDWAAGPYFLKISVDGTDMGTSQLLSVPYALYAKTSGSSADAVKVTGNQTIAGNKTFSGTTTVATPLNPTDAANKAYVDVLLDKILQLEAEAGVKDVDGNSYKAVKIGTQVWMTENLKTTKYNDGSDIPLIIGNTSWKNLTTPGYCWYNNDEASYKATYGAMYNWYTVDTGKLCPTGWHVPADAEWIVLTDYLGGDSVAGGKLKESGINHWPSPNTGATNESGFTALPSGFRDPDGYFGHANYAGYWWSSSEVDANVGWSRGLYYTGSQVGIITYTKTVGIAIRCIKD